MLSVFSASRFWRSISKNQLTEDYSKNLMWHDQLTSGNKSSEVLPDVHSVLPHHANTGRAGRIRSIRESSPLIELMHSLSKPGAIPPNPPTLLFFWLWFLKWPSHLKGVLILSEVHVIPWLWRGLVPSCRHSCHGAHLWPMRWVDLWC